MLEDTSLQPGTADLDGLRMLTDGVGGSVHLHLGLRTADIDGDSPPALVLVILGACSSAVMSSSR